jgi:hypothetical protein
MPPVVCGDRFRTICTRLDQPAEQIHATRQGNIGIA